MLLAITFAVLNAVLAAVAIAGAVLVAGLDRAWGVGFGGLFVLAYAVTALAFGWPRLASLHRAALACNVLGAIALAATCASVLLGPGGPGHGNGLLRYALASAGGAAVFVLNIAVLAVVAARVA